MPGPTVNPNHWVYLVNDASPNWGYKRADGTHLPVREYFLGAHTRRRQHNWRLGQDRKNFAAGDVLWVRASLPLAAFVGYGIARTGLKERNREYRFDVEWDGPLSRWMAENPISGILEKHTQAMRLLLPNELAALRRAVHQGPAPSSPGTISEHTPPEAILRRLREAIDRQGQVAFRSRLIEAYDGTCAFTGCGVVDALDAAHIAGYATSGDNGVRNGLLLRSDVHILFDKGLLWVRSDQTIGVARHLHGSEYGGLEGMRIHVPSDPGLSPDRERLREHRTTIARQEA